MRIFAAILPALTAMILIVVAVLPWGADKSLHFVLPLLPLIAIHYWTVRHPRYMPVLFVFAAGLIIDALTNGPLGIWSLTFLIGYWLATVSRGLIQNRSTLGRWFDFTIAMLLVAGAIWIISSIYFLTPFNWQPMAIAVALTSAAYPVIAFLCWPIRMIWLTHDIAPYLDGTQ